MAFKLGKINDQTEQGRLGLSFAQAAFTDYLAARVLLNEGLLLQGATLASTAVEKYLKLMLGARWLKTNKHLDSIDLDVVLATGAHPAGVRRDFLDLMGLVYKTRYLDSLPSIITFCLEGPKVLAELDFTVSVLVSNFDLIADGVPMTSPYQSAKDNNHPHLFKNNYVLQNSDKATAVAAPGAASAYWINQQASVIECRSNPPNWNANDQSSFTRAGFTKNADGTYLAVAFDL